MDGQRRTGVSSAHLLPCRPALTKAELARAYWRAVTRLRHLKPNNVYTLGVLAYFELQFRAAWNDPRRRSKRMFELLS